MLNTGVLAHKKKVREEKRKKERNIMYALYHQDSEEIRTGKKPVGLLMWNKRKEAKSKKQMEQGVERDK